MRKTNLLYKVNLVFEKLTTSQKVIRGLEFLKEDHEHTLREQKVICEISAPTFKEENRGKDYMKRLEDLGLQDVHIDEVGNVLGRLKGTGKGPKLVVAAHLDTVFKEGVDTSVQERDGKLCAPGIADDTRGLAELLSIARAFRETGIKPIGEIIFCGNVGEEGLGDLKGVKHLFERYGDIDGFITVDGSGVETITYLGTGSHRYKVIYKGPGGHSFSDFGAPSANHAMGRAIAKIAEINPPSDPKTTFTVGLVEGGTSINSIAEKACMHIDLRSNSKTELLKIESAILNIIKKAAEEENYRWNHKGKVEVDIELIGDRPVGEQSMDTPIVQAAIAAIKSIGLIPRLEGPSSTDANLPISLGIPAVALGRGGSSGNIHTIKEWFDPTDAYKGPQKTFLTILSLVGIENHCEPILPHRILCRDFLK